MKRLKLVAAVVAFGLAATCSAARAWYFQGHAAATKIAVQALPREMPAFFAEGIETIAHCVGEPDLLALPEVPELRNAIAPEHFLDLEILRGEELPPVRYEYIALCARKGLDPSRVGLLPYAVCEWTQRVAVAFAEQRKWPTDPLIQVKCMVYSGILCHYAQDMCQPLHSTVHYDGRVGPGGASPRSGIHARVDALLEKLDADPATITKNLEIRPFDKLMPAIVEELRRSHTLVDRVYDLEPQIPQLKDPLAPKSKTAVFAEERMREAVRFTACLLLTAWNNSASIALPEWDVR